MRFYCFVLILIFAGASLAYGAPAQSVRLRQSCERMASIPVPHRMGTESREINPAVAVDVCTQAVKSNALDHDLIAYLARALVMGGEKKKAHDLIMGLGQTSSSEVLTYRGIIFSKGFGTNQDHKHAVFWYRKAALLGHPVALHNLGTMYELGEGVNKDLQAAKLYYRRAAARGYALAAENLSQLYDRDSTKSSSVRLSLYWMRKAAEAGNAEYQYDYALRLLSENGPDAESAYLAWLRRAASGQDRFALSRLAYEYYAGDHVRRDRANALRLYKMAAAKGSSSALYEVARMYLYGLGINKDEAAAEKYLRMALRAGKVEAKIELADLLLDQKRGYVEATRILRELASQGNAEAMSNLAVLYLDGEGVPKDASKAVYLLNDAADKGDFRARHLLAVYQGLGVITPPDTRRGIHWAQTLTDDNLGRYRLAQLLRRENLDKNNDESIKFLTIAAEDIDDAKHDLATAYILGDGVTKDIPRALADLRTLAKNGHEQSMITLAEVLSTGEYTLPNLSEAATWHVRSSTSDDAYPKEELLKAWYDAKSPLRKALFGDEGLVKQLRASAAKIGADYEESPLGCRSPFMNCGEVLWRRVDLTKASNWYRIGGTTSADAAFRLGRLLRAHPELAAYADEGRQSLDLAVRLGSSDARFLSELNLSQLNGHDRNAKVRALLSSFPPATAARLAFQGAIGRFGDDVIGPAFLYLRSPHDKRLTPHKVNGLISVYAYYGAFDQGRLLALELGEAKWFELSGWSYSIERMLQLWYEALDRGIAPEPNSLRALESFLLALDMKGSSSANELLSTLLDIKAEHQARTSNAATRAEPSLSELEAEYYALQMNIEALEVGPVAPMLVPLYQRLARTQVSLGRVDEAESSVITALALSEKIGANTRHLNGSLQYHLDRSCQYSLASEILFDAGKADHALLQAKNSINELQSAREILRGLPADLRGCFKTVVGDQYRFIADLLIRNKHFTEAEWVLEQLKDYEAYEFSDRDPELANRAFARIPLTSSQLHITREIIGLPLLQRYRILERLNAIDAAEEPTPEQERAESELRVQLEAADQILSHSLANLHKAAVSLGRNDAEGSLRAGALSGSWFITRSDRLDELRNTALIYSVVLPDKLHILVTTGGGTEHFQISIHSDVLNGMVENLRADLQNSESDPLQSSKVFYDTVWKSIDDSLRRLKVTNIVLSLDGQLRYLPFAAVHDGRNYMIERYKISYITSNSVDLLTSGRSLKLSSIQALGVTKGGFGFDPLPNVADELDSLVRSQANPAGLFPGRQWRDGEFTKRRLQRALKTRSPIIHIATHFKLGSSLDTSTLLLGTQLLTVKELVDGVASNRFDFGASELVVFTACETGSGNGREMEGLAINLDKVGLKSVVATLWAVNDKSTSKFVVLFYSNLKKGLPRAEALRDAQLSFIRSTDRMPSSYAHTLHWAPFVILGQSN
jgi:CHAT domain-containing protein/TPR repeat protein